MANKYYFRLPYSCDAYGTRTGYVIARDEEQAIDRISNGNIDDDECTDEGSDNFNYDYDEVELELEEENIEDTMEEELNGDDYNDDESIYYYNNDSDETYRCFNWIDQDEIPNYFLSEILSL